MKKIEFNCEIITPLVMAGAEMQPELRTQSFNGLFRYWFRLLGGSFEDEKKLFGWGGEKANKGIVKIIIEKGNFGESKEFQKKRETSGYNYIGFSLILTKRKLIEKGNFKILFYFHPTSTEEDIKKFLCAVWCAFYLGNFGSRSRRGFGSIVIKSINGNIPNNDFGLTTFSPQQNIENWIKDQLEKIKSLSFWKGREDIPYIFENLEIYKIVKNNIIQHHNWISSIQSNRRGRFLVNKWGLSSITNEIDLLDFMGFLLMAYRSYYQPDYNNVKNTIQQRSTQNLEEVEIERVIFGLPLNFYFSSLRRGATVQAKMKNNILRRSSPLIFKIISNFSSNNFEGFILVFKSNKRHSFKFLPDEAKIEINNIEVKTPDWKCLNDFISSLEKYNLIQKIYP